MGSFCVNRGPDIHPAVHRDSAPLAEGRQGPLQGSPVGSWSLKAGGSGRLQFEQQFCTVSPGASHSLPSLSLRV